jgi:hypothetical protein
MEKQMVVMEVIAEKITQELVKESFEEVTLEAELTIEENT